VVEGTAFAAWTCSIEEIYVTVAWLASDFSSDGGHSPSFSVFKRCDVFFAFLIFQVLFNFGKKVLVGNKINDGFARVVSFEFQLEKIKVRLELRRLFDLFFIPHFEIHVVWELVGLQ